VPCLSVETRFLCLRNSHQQPPQRLILDFSERCNRGLCLFLFWGFGWGYWPLCLFCARAPCFSLSVRAGFFSLFSNAFGTRAALTRNREVNGDVWRTSSPRPCNKLDCVVGERTCFLSRARCRCAARSSPPRKKKQATSLELLLTNLRNYVTNRDVSTNPVQFLIPVLCMLCSLLPKDKIRQSDGTTAE
jgi:hypothetical protein